MTTPTDGGPAFPQARPDVPPDFRGMTLRDWFAGQALAGLLANSAIDVLAPSEWASDAYNIAQAMLAERARRQERVA